MMSKREAAEVEHMQLVNIKVEDRQIQEYMCLNSTSKLELTVAIYKMKKHMVKI